MLLLHGLSINTYYSIIIVKSCTLMINKVTQTRCSSTYFFLLTQYTALKVLFQQRRTWTSIFSSIPWIRRRGPLGRVMSRWSTTIFLTCSTKMLVVFLDSLALPRNTWTDLWLGMAQDVTIKSSSCQDSPDYFTCSYFFDGFLQEMREVRTIEFTETSGACWR